MKTITPELRAKLTKVLRLQTSCNANEAANAAQVLDKLCKQWEISPNDIDEDYDPEKDEAIEWAMGDIRIKQDVAINVLIGSVANYYNGRTIIAHAHDKWTTPREIKERQLKVIATRGNQIQIELYSEYLIETMEKLADDAKREDPLSPREFRQNFRKGFSITVRDRLNEMKKVQEKEGKPDISVPALIVVNRNTIERQSVNDFINCKYPRLKSGNHFKLGAGSAKGREAASSVSLNKQVEKAASTKALKPVRTDHRISTFG